MVDGIPALVLGVSGGLGCEWRIASFRREFCCRVDTGAGGSLFDVYSSSESNEAGRVWPLMPRCSIGRIGYWRDCVVLSRVCS